MPFRPKIEYTVSMSRRKRRARDGEEGEAVAETLRPSRSQAKRDAKAALPLAEALVKLAPRRLNRLELEPALHDAVVECRRMARAARQRQLKLIAGYLRAEDWRAIQESLSQG